MILVVAGLISAAVTTIAAVQLARRPQVLTSMVVGVGSASVWSIGGVIAEVGSPGTARLGVAVVVVASSGVLYGFACHARDMLSQRWHLNLGPLPLLGPAVVIAATLTDPWLHLLVVDVQTDPLVITGGPVLVAHVIYGFSVVGVATVVHLLSVIIDRPDLRATARPSLQVMVSTAAVFVPGVGAVLTVLRSSTGMADYAGATMGLTVLVWWWAERPTLGLPSLVITTAQTLQALPDAVVVSDSRERIVAANDAAVALLSRQAKGHLVGKVWGDLVDTRLIDRMRVVDHEVLHGLDARTIDVRVARLTTPDGMPQGTVVVLRDVTEVEHLRDELAELSVRDGLTGLHNRRHLDRVLGPLVAEALSTGTPLSALMVDIDHFKNINDTYGHAVGDRVLAAVAAELSRCIRSGDTLVRFGGEEFLALLPATSAEVAGQRAEACRARVAALKVSTDAGDVHVTLSAGIAGLRTDADVLLREADDALYDAKLAGRNRVVLAGRGLR